jgi:hypothetical protein
MSPDCVVLEVASVKGPPELLALDGDLWKEVDEQCFPTELRCALAENGFRFGVIGPQLPEALRRLLEAGEDSLGIRGADGKAIQGLLAPGQRLQSRAGERYDIVASNAPGGEMVVLLREGGQVRGGTYQDAQCVFAMKSFPKGDGRVEVDLTPEVRHGPRRQNWVGREGVFVLDADREREVFKQLRAHALLSPGRTLLLTCTPDPKGLGRQFFVQQLPGGPETKILLIRLAQTQLDDLFAPDQVFSPIATRAE